jgi:hypothetical protein
VGVVIGIGIKYPGSRTKKTWADVPHRTTIYKNIKSVCSFFEFDSRGLV